MINVVLLYATSQYTGKTYLANELVKRGLAEARLSFALRIKEVAHRLQELVSDVRLTPAEFQQSRKDEKIFNNLSPRDLTCDVSDLIQKYFTEDVWAKYIEKQIDSIGHDSVIILDDWRRSTESSYLENTGKYNILKVYLEKEDFAVKPSTNSTNYEGKISKEDCDIVFKYKSDYSNFEEIIGLIKDATTFSTKSL